MLEQSNQIRKIVKEKFNLNIQKVEAYKLNLNQNALDSVDELIEH